MRAVRMVVIVGDVDESRTEEVDGRRPAPWSGSNPCLHVVHDGFPLNNYYIL